MKAFEKYLKQGRRDFTKVAGKYPVEKHLELRTAINSLLIAYDQAVHQALSLGGVVRQSEQYHCELYGFGRRDKPCDKQCDGCKAMNLD